MIGLQILLAQLVGDYVLQNDWMATNKTTPYPAPVTTHDGINTPAEQCADLRRWVAEFDRWQLGHLACLVHCLCYTLAVAAFCYSWMPWWGYVATGGLHFPIDRWRLARRWMTLVGQEAFATGPFSPWSIIVVDNIMHLLTLYVIALCAGAG